MAYTTSTLVTAEFKGITFGATTAVTTTALAVFIGQADAFINSKIGLKYSTPVTGVESLLILNQISTLLVAGRVKNILEVKTQTPGATQGTGGAGDTMIKEAKDMLQNIVQGLLLLSDADLVTSADGWRSNAVDEDLEYEFDTTEQQW